MARVNLILEAIVPFPKGILVTVRAVRGLLADLQKKLGDGTYLLTRHLTYDRLEGIFSAWFVAVAVLTRTKARVRLQIILMLTSHEVSPLCKTKEANIAFCTDEDR